MNIRKYWINLVHRAATGTKKIRTLLTPVGILIFGLFTGLFIFLSLLVDRAIGLPWPVSNSVSLLVSIPMLVIGAALTAWSAFHFLKVRGTPVPFNPPPELVQSGPYKYVRNPMLTGVFLVLFGIGFAVRLLSLVLIFTPLFILVNVWELKKIEEPELARRLGDDYIKYQKKTPMFIPGIRFKK
jgi:protein-S-isoprenylcysteine O-methyltransferase Ste14